jgi:CubicO group peptidase (beta-lactamase class C family)
MTPRHDLAPAATGWRGRIRSGAIVLGCLAGVLLSGGSVAAADRIAAEVRDEVVRRVESEEIVGVVVGVVDAEGASYFGYGRLSAGGEQAPDEYTIFEIGSITKAFTGVLLAEMAERGLVALDEPVARLLPQGSRVPSRDGRQISLRDLAGHRSGLPRLPDNLAPKDVANPYADYTAAKMLEFLRRHKLGRAIGATYEYSNLGVGLLGYALAQRAGATYEELVIERLARPLGLEDTRITLSAEQRSRLARGHAGGRPVANWDIDALAGAGALRSTASDMLRFLAANLGLVETPLAAALMASRQDPVETGQEQLAVALGWHVRTGFDRQIVWHNGGTGGYRSFCGFDPAARRGVVVLSNSTSEVVDALGLHLLEPRYELPEVREAVAADAATLADYVGYYQLAPGVRFHITTEDGRLFAQLTGQERYPVFSESETEFFYKVVDAQLTFVRGEDGEVDHLVLHQGGDRKAQRLHGYEPPVRAEMEVAAAVLERYVGSYELAPGVEMTVTRENDRLFAQVTNQPRFPVFAESETVFFFKVVEAQITFETDEQGGATGLVLLQGGIEHRARRIR